MSYYEALEVYAPLQLFPGVKPHVSAEDTITVTTNEQVGWNIIWIEKKSYFSNK